MWDSTVKIMNDLFDSVWGAKEEIVYDQAMDLTLPVRTSSFLHVF